MILDENFMILDEDEDIDLLDEDILLEGEVVLNEIGFVKNIKSGSDIDKEASSEKIAKAKAKYKQLLASGYRAYKSSDNGKLKEALNSSEFKKSIATYLFSGVPGIVSTKINLNSFGYSLFNYEGMTLLSCYRKNNADANLRLTKGSNKLRPVGGSNYVYMVLVKEDTDKVVLKRISVVGLRNTADSRLEEN